MAGTLTRLQMVTEVLDNMSRSTVGLTRNQATVGDRAVVWLDRAQIWVSRRESLLFDIATAATVASQKDYTFPSNVRGVFSLRLEDGLNSIKLRPVLPRTFDKLIPKPDSYSTEGRPDFYVPYAETNTFELWRIPDQAYTMRIRYSYWPTALSTDGQVSDFSYMDDVLIFKATEYGFSWLQELRDAREWSRRASQALEEAIAAERDGMPDMEYVSQGFDSRSESTIGEYYNDPFRITSP